MSTSTSTPVFNMTDGQEIELLVAHFKPIVLKWQADRQRFTVNLGANYTTSLYPLKARHDG